jgi:hypothetical protein
VRRSSRDQIPGFFATEVLPVLRVNGVLAVRIMAVGDFRSRHDEESGVGPGLDLGPLDLEVTAGDALGGGRVLGGHRVGR